MRHSSLPAVGHRYRRIGDPSRPFAAGLLALTLSLPGAAAPATAPGGASTASADRSASASPRLIQRAPWAWPVDGHRVTVRFVAPESEYGSGHRGIDIAPLHPGAVRSPADGTIAFAGTVAGRSLLTVDHGDGVVSTLEPVHAALAAGAVVRRGDVIGTLAVGGHAVPGTLHLGVRVDGQYVDPLIMYGDAEQAILLPCCD